MFFILRSFKDLQSTQTDEDAVDLTSVTCTTVRGSLYEADILGRECRPLYWRGIYFSILYDQLY